MNWEAIGALGEILSACAVLVTLLYLAAQVRQVKKDLHISSYREINKFFGSAAASVTVSPELAKAIARSKKGEKLDDWEEVLLGEYYFQVMTALEVAWQHIEVDTLNVVSNDVLLTIDWFLDKPGMKKWWKDNRQGFLVSWQEVVDSRLGTGGDA